MRAIFPSILVNKTYQFERDGGHQIYVEESGNADGIPVIFCHGGPGGASSPMDRRFYDPEMYRIIIFDQRGCGQSTPHAQLTDNDTWRLVADIEYIRQQLAVTSWVVSGGSWGTTLALVYAINYPKNVLGLILRGIFLARQQDYLWLYSQSGGAAQLFPDHYQKFIQQIEPCPVGEEIQAYYRLLIGDNEVRRLQAAKVWTIWEGKISTLAPQVNIEQVCGEAHLALSMSRLEAHYFVNNCFIADNYIIDNLEVIKHIPGFIIHGRYDVVCKVENAFTLAKHWPAAQLQVIPNAGHSGKESATAEALCRASVEMVKFIH